MRKIMLFIMLCTVFQIDSTPSLTKSDELFNIAQVVQNQNLIIDEWELIYKDKINGNNLNAIINFLNKHNETKKDINENHTAYTLIEKADNVPIDLIYNLLIPNNFHDSAHITITIKGTEWNYDKNYEFIRENSQLFNQFLTNSSSVFTCLSATDSVIIGTGISLKKLRDEFNLLHSFTQFDNNIESKYIEEIYGYNPNWNSKLLTEQSPVNIQIALKQDENKRNLVTIGTPIILNEY